MIALLLSSGLLGLFLIAVLVICVTPGPDMVYIAAHGISQGVPAGLVAAVGMAIGMVCHTAAATLGLAALLQTVPVAYEAVRYAGAVYLAVIGIRTLRDARRLQEIGDQPPVPLSAVLRRAVFTNLLNPKIVLFYVAFLPQFVDRSLGHATLQFLLLGLLFVVVGLLVDCGVALLSGRVGTLLARRPTASRRVHQVSGLVLLSLAARVALP